MRFQQQKENPHFSGDTGFRKDTFISGSAVGTHDNSPKFYTNLNL